MELDLQPDNMLFGGRHPLASQDWSQATVSIKIRNLLICFCSFDLSCPVLEKLNFIENVYTVFLLNSVILKLGFDLV